MLKLLFPYYFKRKLTEKKLGEPQKIQKKTLKLAEFILKIFKSNFILKPETGSINLKQIRETKFVKTENIKLNWQKTNLLSHSPHGLANFPSY